MKLVRGRGCKKLRNIPAKSPRVAENSADTRWRNADERPPWEEHSTNSENLKSFIFISSILYICLT